MDAHPPQPPDGQEIIDLDHYSPRSQSPVWNWPSPTMQNETPNLDPWLPPAALRDAALENYQLCLEAMKAVFPDISHDHVQLLWNKTERKNFTEKEALYQSLIERILDGGPYPKERDRLKDLKKRKRSSPEAEAAKWKYTDLRHDPEEYARVARARLSERFHWVPTKFINEAFKEHSHFYGAFFAIDEADRRRDDPVGSPFQKLKSRRVSGIKSEQIMASLEAEGYGFAGLREEMRAAEARWQKAEDERNAAKERTKAKMASDEEYRRKGETMECACCFSDDNPPTDMTHCNADVPHFFCFTCAKRNAETDMTSLKYALRCMDQSRCEATFSRDERARFLDATAIEKLERLQQQDDIRRAEMGDLEACPFCEYAAICPPPEVDRVFECQNPDCMETSCRLCRDKAHIPLSCEEFKKENGIGERHVIEEARTDALIRSCKKCNIRILKEDGCNKVVCTNCYSVICDYCGEDISKTKYDHFDASPRGRSIKGKCPLYDPSNRKDEQIERAGKAALEKVRQENPNLSEDDLKIKFAKAIEDQSKRDTGLQKFEEIYLARHAEIIRLRERVAGDGFAAGNEMQRVQGNFQQQVQAQEVHRQQLDALLDRRADMRAAHHGRRIHERVQRQPQLPGMNLARDNNGGQGEAQNPGRHNIDLLLQFANEHRHPRPHFPDINPARNTNGTNQGEAPNLAGHNNDLLLQFANGPQPPHLARHRFGRPMAPLPGGMGLNEWQREWMGRDFQPGIAGFAPLIPPYNNVEPPTGTEEQRRGSPQILGNLENRSGQLPHHLSKVAPLGEIPGTRAHDYNQRNGLRSVGQFGRPFLGDRPRANIGPHRGAIRPNGVNEWISAVDQARAPPARPGQQQWHERNLQHIGTKDMANPISSNSREGDIIRPGFANPTLNEPTRYAPPPGFGHRIDAPIDLDADTAVRREDTPYWNFDQNIPNFGNGPFFDNSAGFGHGVEAVGEGGGVWAPPRVQDGQGDLH